MLKVYVISDRKLCTKETSAFVRACARGGAAMFQLREKDLPDRELLLLARRAVNAARGTRMKILVNGRWDIARAAGAHGVHLGARGLPVDKVRRRAGRREVIGYSAHGMADARRAAKDGAGFVTFSPVFSTREPFKGRPKGISALRRAASALCVPVYALGGISLQNARRLRGTGIAGVAAVSALALSSRPEKAVRELRRAVLTSSSGKRGNSL